MLKDETRKIAKELELSSEKIDSALEQLQSMGIVRWKDGKYVNLNKKMHLSKDSPLCHPNQQLLRIMSMQKLEQLRSQSDDQQYNVAITYSATPQAHHRIRERFLEFLKEFDEILEQSANKCVYQMNFDLFSWSQN